MVRADLISIWFNSVVLLSLPVVGNHLDCYRCCSAFMNLEYYERGLCTYYMRYGIELYYAILIVIVIILTADRVSKIEIITKLTMDNVSIPRPKYLKAPKDGGNTVGVKLI